jgi:hydrogenase maturation protease
LKRVRIIGIGNPDRGDDAAGRHVARILRDRLPGVDVLELDGEAAQLLDHLVNADSVILVDASYSGGEPGTTRRFDVADSPLPAQRPGASTHGLGACEAIELARALGRLPERCLVYTIEGAHFEPGTPLSPAVRRAVAGLATELCASDVSVD